MADPSIQTFCCRDPNINNPSLSILEEFNSTSYNVVCLISSLLGISGAIYQLLPRAESQSQRWFSLTSIRGRSIIIWLAVADLLASLGVFMRSVVKLNDSIFMRMDENQPMIYCIILAVWIEYFYVVTWVWTLFYAIDMSRALQQKPGFPKVYHAIAWTLPAVLTSVGLSILYLPKADCHSSSSDPLLRLLPNSVVLYAPIVAVMIVNPVLYVTSLRFLGAVVSRCLGQVTRKERLVVEAVRARFGLMNLVFYLCWTPNIINGIIVWASWFSLPKNTLLVLWYAMAVMNPLQALFNSLVYRRSNQKIISPFRGADESTPLVTSNINT